MDSVVKKILIIIVLLAPLPVLAYERTCSQAPIESATCALSCEGTGISCPDQNCGGENACGEQECCCVPGENPSEIRMGRLMDETEYLADKIIEWSEKEIQAAQAEITFAQELYRLSGDCKSEHCRASCKQESICAGCDCGGCSEGTISVPDDNSCDPIGGDNEMRCCTPQAPEEVGTIFKQTYQTGTNPCLPGSPSNLYTNVSGRSVTFFWDNGAHVCDDICATSCLPEPEFIIGWKKSTEENWHYLNNSYSLQNPRTLDFSDYDEGQYDWMVRQVSNIDHSPYAQSYSSIFTLSEEYGDVPTPINLQASPFFGQACKKLLSWDSGCTEENNGCFGEVSYRLEYDGPSSASFSNLNTNLIVEFDPTGTYTWRVKQSNLYDSGTKREESDWAETTFVVDGETPPRPPQITDIFSTRDSITVTWDDSAGAGCGDCSCSECHEAEYKVEASPTAETIAKVGSIPTVETDWIDANYTVISNLYSGADYNVEVFKRNGCGVASVYASSETSKTICADGSCQVETVCEEGKMAAPKSCEKPLTNSCVSSEMCSNNGGTAVDPSNCLPACTGENVCCSNSSLCVESASQCHGLGGYLCRGDTTCMESFCLGRCSSLSETTGNPFFCCAGIDEAAPSGEELSCGSYSPSACCDAAQSRCEPQGCSGNPCPVGIASALGGVGGAYQDIVEAREKIDEYWGEMRTDVPPKLKEVRRKLSNCFVEQDLGAAIARREKGVKEIVECSAILNENEFIHSFIPDPYGNPKERVDEFCYGTKYCETMIRNDKEELLPYPSPCAEDIYCCTWQ